MKLFKQNQSNGVILDTVRNTETNTDYSITDKKVQDWIAEGNTFEPAETEQEENDRLLADQEKELVMLYSSNEYHLISRRFAADREMWETILDKWAAQLEEVKNGTLVEIEPLPVFN